MATTVKILSYNIQHGNDYRTDRGIDLGQIARIIAQSGADIVGLQEVRGAGADPLYTAQCEKLAQLLGMYGYFAPALDIPAHGPYGNAVLSRMPMRTAKIVPIPDPPPATRRSGGMYETRCIAQVEFALHNTAPFTLLVTHMGLEAEEQLAAVDTVLSTVAQSRSPVVLMGDFNMESDHPLMQKLTDVLHDTAAHFACPQNSFPADAPRIRIDYVLCDARIAVNEAQILPLVGSDHRPYLCSITLPDQW